MAKIVVRNRCSDFNSYRAARVKSLFNAESGCDFDLTADLPVDESDWKIGLVVGPSGSGKTSIGKQLFGGGKIWEAEWPHDRPVIDAIAPGGSFDEVTGALAAVGLGSVPSWLRPYPVLSNGEKFRCDLARVICEKPGKVIVDEFTSVVDRQIAKFGALAFAKAWRRTGGQCVLLSCHYDIVEWVEPDWVFDTATGEYRGRNLWRRPKFDVVIHKTDWRYWPRFEPHYYLKLHKMPGAVCYVAQVDGEQVAHVGVSTVHNGKGLECRMSRLVVMPEWQGAGIGIRFLNAVCEAQLTGDPLARMPGRSMTSLFHTSHPGLVAALRRDPKWQQVSAMLYGGNKAKSKQSIVKAAMVKGSKFDKGGSGYGGHFRAVQGFRYVGAAK